MKVVAAYLFAVLGGNTSLSADDLKDFLGSVGAEADDERIELLLSQIKDKDITELLEEKNIDIISKNFSNATMFIKRLRPPPLKNSTSKHRDHNHQDSLKNLTPAKTKKLNEGKKIGLIFVGVVAILQDEIALRRRCLLYHLHYLSIVGFTSMEWVIEPKVTPIQLQKNLSLGVAVESVVLHGPP
ncbi:60S acidic ribosomal protein P2B [Forsythia ovata]|uniref:60S acidic ribosomal protein P2B n=1 Tax=Forsythia ovata TaxID=205694 RepID=A0ABD1SQR0_9LAMI